MKSRYVLAAICSIASVLTISGDNSEASAYQEMFSGASDDFSVASVSEVVVHQGDTIVNPYNDAKCTVGFVDKVHRSVVTSAQCVPNVGDEVTNGDGEAIGRVNEKTVDTLAYETYSGDKAIVQVYPHVVVGENVFSGDAIVPMDNIRAGDIIHAYGISHHSVFSGVVSENSPHYNGVPVVYSEVGMNPFPGDAGGAVWIEGKGIVGIISVSGGVRVEDSWMGATSLDKMHYGKRFSLSHDGSVAVKN